VLAKYQVSAEHLVKEVYAKQFSDANLERIANPKAFYRLPVLLSCSVSKSLSKTQLCLQNSYHKID
jgi:hypothetical protein